MKILLGVLAGAAGIALIGQTYAALHPAYDNILLEPDPVIGWKFAPNLEFVNTGDHWYANELSVRHKTNSLGFIGPERSVIKPPHTSRIALLGDSFVEALQVPWEKSAAGNLERSLNQLATSGSPPLRRYEVLNFGLSNLSVGQYLLIWEEYVSKFSPDYIFVFIAQEPLRRTPERKADWGIQIGRPSFELVNGNLIRLPVQDYEQSVDAFDQEIQRRGGRSRKRKQRIWITDWIKSGDLSRSLKSLIPQRLRLALKQLVAGGDTIKPFLPSLHERVKRVFKPAQDKAGREEALKVDAEAESQTLEILEEALEVNLSVLAELNEKVSRTGAEMVVVDASLYFLFLGANEVLTQRIYRFCIENDIAFIPLYRALLETDRNNLWARFPHSHHFNEHGNAIFARQMLEWIETHSKKGPSELSSKKYFV